MTFGQTAYLAMVIAGFSLFGVTLFVASLWSSLPRAAASASARSAGDGRAAAPAAPPAAASA